MIVLAILSETDLKVKILYLTSWQLFSAISNELFSFKGYILSIFGIYLLTSIRFISLSIIVYWKFLYVFGTFVYIIIQFMQRYVIEKSHRDVFLSENKIKCELKKINDILSILVPSFVKDLFLRGSFDLNYLFFETFLGIYTLSEEQPNVAILFCDIYEFDKIVATESTNIVKILDNLYRVFDQICLETSNQKIEVTSK